ncbi:MAG TPA: glycosyltransferase family 4 protein [Steroidobacteraceae bacterium]|nr:glycosyltransferase family 4 protein [Steroidobacteraceae bacterium]
MRRVLILVENLPSPFDRRVWQEACTLRGAGYAVSIICPTGPGCERRFEIIDGVHIYRYRLPLEAAGGAAYLLEYSCALAQTFILSWRVLLTRGFDVVHACNPPDLLFLVGGFFKLLGKKFLFDHHDLCPELYEAKFGRRGLLYRAQLWLERATFRTADVSIATNDSYRQIAITRGGMRPERVFVVRSGPSLARLERLPPDERLKCGRRYLVGYVGVIGQQEGIDSLLRSVRHLVFELGRRDIHFGVVGGGPLLERMKALAADLGVAQFVTFTGRVPDRELLAMLNTAEVCVNPDAANDMNDKSTMNKVLEYMALAKPIVQFDLTEGRWAAQQASLYARRHDSADFAARIVELIDDPERRAAMGAFGRRRIETQLEWSHQAPRLLAAYDALWRRAGALPARGGARVDSPGSPR